MTLRNRILWVSMTPLCALAIACFYKGAVYSVELQAERLSQTAPDSNFGAVLLVFGGVLILTVVMGWLNMFVHVWAGAKIFREQLPEIRPSQFVWRSSDCRQTKAVKMLSYGCTLLYAAWCVYGAYQGNRYYCVWSAMAIVVTRYYCWCLFASETASGR